MSPTHVYGGRYSRAIPDGSDSTTGSVTKAPRNPTTCGNTFRSAVSAIGVHRSPRYTAVYSGVYTAGTDTVSGPSHSGRYSPDTVSVLHVSPAHST